MPIRILIADHSTITADGRVVFHLELRPHASPILEVSSPGLAVAIRDAVGVQDRKAVER